MSRFVAAAAAMQYLPLFMVQAGVASSVGITALLAALLGVPLPRRSVVALCRFRSGGGWCLVLAQHSAGLPTPGRAMVPVGDRQSVPGASCAPST